MTLTPPTPLTAEHDVASFTCRHESLATWLERRALANSASGASRTYVVCTGDERVVGYYALAAGSIAVKVVPSRVRRNMPDPLPVIVLSRLAVHADSEGRGIGSGLLKDALVRSMRAADLIGVRAVLCHAIDEDAKALYLKHGFVESPREPLVVLLGLR